MDSSAVGVVGSSSPEWRLGVNPMQLLLRRGKPSEALSRSDVGLKKSLLQTIADHLASRSESPPAGVALTVVVLSESDENLLRRSWS